MTSNILKDFWPEFEKKLSRKRSQESAEASEVSSQNAYDGFLVGK